jgi:tRNA threonylcarbamoyladenosine biosynthesis protein TsaB
MKIFALDCATPTVSLALLDDEKVLGELYLDLGRHHAETLLPAAERLLSLVGGSWGKVDLLACTVGPGSFTGVRIGISTIKGLSLATDKPIAAVTTLEALAQNGTPGASWICPLVDARKSQVYTALYRPGEGNPVLATPPRLTAIDSLLAELPAGGSFSWATAPSATRS